MANNGNGKFTAEQMIDAIRRAEGNLSDAARILECSRTTVHRYVNKFSTVKQAYEEENDKFIDEAQGQLRRHVKKGSLPAIMFLLKTKGKHLGYVERQEVEPVGEVKIRVIRNGNAGTDS
jgi:hypothetical protein